MISTSPLNKLLRLIPLLALSLILAGCPLPLDTSTPEVIPASKAQPAPDFSLPDLKGNTIRLANYSGKVVLLGFWATWCPPCRSEIPTFVQLQSDYQSRGFSVIGISSDDTEAREVREFAQEHGINYPVVMEDGQVSKDYGGVRYLPTTFVIDRKQRIRMKVVGAVEKEVFEETIQQLLQE